MIETPDDGWSPSDLDYDIHRAGQGRGVCDERRGSVGQRRRLSALCCLPALARTLARSLAPPTTMTDALKQLANRDGVIGAFLCTRIGGIVAYEPPTLVTSVRRYARVATTAVQAIDSAFAFKDEDELDEESTTEGFESSSSSSSSSKDTTSTSSSSRDSTSFLRINTRSHQELFISIKDDGHQPQHQQLLLVVVAKASSTTTVALASGLSLSTSSATVPTS